MKFSHGQPLRLGIRIRDEREPHLNAIAIVATQPHRLPERVVVLLALKEAALNIGSVAPAPETIPANTLNTNVRICLRVRTDALNRNPLLLLRVATLAAVRTLATPALAAAADLRTRAAHVPRTDPVAPATPTAPAVPVGRVVVIRADAHRGAPSVLRDLGKGPEEDPERDPTGPVDPRGVASLLVPLPAFAPLLPAKGVRVRERASRPIVKR